MRSEERAHNERLANDRYREAGRDKHPLRSLRSLLFCILYFSCFIALVSCHYSRPNLEDEHLSKETRDSLAYLFERHYTWNTNLEVLADSVNLACLPVKDCYNMLYRGDRVVVAEFAIHPADSVDSVWVKLAHSQEVQGWLRESEMMHAFVPTDSISQAIYLFSDTHASYFIIIFALFVAVWLFRAFRRKQLRMVYFNDIDSLYPLLLCLLMAFCATIYESIQVFAPETWQHFYFNPTLSPFKVPLVLSAFLMGIWLFIVVLLAVLDDLFRQLSPAAAVFYLLGLASCCIFCYFFFKTEQIMSYFNAQGAKAAIPGINKKDVENIYIFSPDNESVIKFGEFAYPLFKQMLKNAIENRRLSLLRDTLLPRLMSGEIEVPQ